MQHRQTHLDRMVPRRERLAIGHRHVALFGADHQDPVFAARVERRVNPAIIIRGGRCAQPDRQRGRAERAVGCGCRCRAEQFA